MTWQQKERPKDNPQIGRKYLQIKQLTKINLQNLQAAHAAQYQKNKQPNPKMSRRPKQIFLQRIYTDCQQTHERMLNITNH